MTFWEMAYGWGWATADQLRIATQYGELTKDDFKRITGEEYDPVPVEPEPEPEPIEDLPEEKPEEEPAPKKK